jgi:glutaryl-CoA dehydrogenase
MASFQGIDYFDVDTLLSEEERMVRDTVREWVDDNLMPIIEEAYIERTLPEGDHPAARRARRVRREPAGGVRLRGAEQRRLRPDHAGAGARRLGHPLLRVRAGRALHVPDLRVRQRGAEAEVPAAHGAGEVIGCFGLTEPDYGSNPGGMITTARQDGDGWVLNGAKMWITNGSMADIAIIWAKTGDIDDVKSIRGFIVPTDTPGFSAKDQKGKLSLLASDTSELVLEDVRVGPEALLPESGGLKSPLMCLTQARYGIAFGVVGAAMACFDEALRYAKERVMFDTVIGAKQIQQVRLADMLTKITQGQLLCLQLGRLKDQAPCGRSRSRSPSAPTATWRRTSPARRAACSAPTASSSSTPPCATWRTSSPSTRTRARTTSTASSSART